ncbi:MULTISPECIES: GNAT family N-acetyltransferase [Kitasatospora]|uniref:Putative acetyltransferase n=1 Tax=Kitasatospora setae (strain ATCC 33774 / DSM 43861 / JCM 3304 / KCC A-0304 / NBRC 14216 / KM-6054) TaxID=452652 RepID=E4N6V3_KITSK|nr:MULTISPECIES: GNAT family N-acetyltransferase [Kitasatospora]BAJ26934.1 putative acetyltransferase [Kitasatospora setae KM-6054]
MALPEGMTVRPAELEDAAAVCALLNQVDEIEIGRAETELGEVSEELARSEVDLARDSWLLHDADGRLVGYGLVRDRSGGARIDLDQYLLPGQLAGGLHLFELMEARATELARDNGAEQAVLHLLLNTEPTTDIEAMRARGWQLSRRYHALTRQVDPATDPLPEPPAGVRLRDCAAEPDRRIAHGLLQRTFADHHDFKPRDYEQWLADINADTVDWSRVWVAELDGQGDVAVLRTSARLPTQAWAFNIGVLPAARGRGLGGYLLRHFFAVYAADGLPTVGLGVDTGNPTGAPELYRKHGMTVDFAVDTWELTLPTALPAGR